MYRVLLVDDEPAALEVLRLAVDWENSGYVICGECNDGEEAVKLAESLQPDLVVTDIRMPVMDGLDLARHIAERMPGKAEVVLVSGYDEFEYAKRAMKYGIRHYVLKPIVKEEFLAVLTEVTEKLVYRDKLKDLDLWDKNLEEYEYFEKFISGAELEPDSAGTAASCGTESGVFWAYAIVKPYSPRTFSPTADKTHISDADLNSALEMPEYPYLVAYLAPLDKEGYGLVLRCGKDESLSHIAGMICAKLNRIYSGQFYLAVSSPADSPAGLAKLASEAFAALNFRFFKSTGSILFYEEFSSCMFNYSLDCIEGGDDICESLENLDMAGLSASIDKVFDAFAENLTSPEVVGIYLTNIVYKGFELIKCMGGSIEEMLEKYPGRMLYFTGMTLEEARAVLQHYCKDVLEFLGRLKNADRQSDMRRVRDYISSNYKNGITIKEMSARLYIHPVYLGHLIQKWFGCSFNEYVHRLRIEEAKRLLSDTDRKVGDIAAELGYGEYAAFLKQFEKYTGVKPAEYRSSMDAAMK